jgi:hypothetical protein
VVTISPKEAYFKCKKENRRISELENVIATDPDYSYRYARSVIKGRWEGGEKSIATRPECSYWYASHIIKGRFKEGEKSIATDSECSYLYAYNIIKGRWEDGEKSIATDSEWSYLYARDLIKGHFELCHHIIFNSKYKDEYVNFLKSINYDLNKISEWMI